MSAARGLPRPEMSVAQAAAVISDLWGVSGDLTELGSQQDRNFRVSSAGGNSALFKVSSQACDTDELDAQNAAMSLLAAEGFAVPEPIPTRAGDDLAEVDLATGTHAVRLLTWVPGRPLADSRVLPEAEIARVGSLAGRISRVLERFDHPGLDRSLQWDLAAARDVVEPLLPLVPDTEHRRQLADAVESAWTVVSTFADELPRQAIHGDLTDDNLVFARPLPEGRLGVIDFGDLHRSWRVAELAVSCSFVLHRNPENPYAVLPLVTAFAREAPLTDAEVRTLWPLIVLRGAVLVVSGFQQLSVDPENEYARERMDAEWRVFSAAAAAPGSELTEILLTSLGMRGVPASPVVQVSSASRPLHLVDVGVRATTPELSEGQWRTQPPEHLEAELAKTAPGDAAFAFGHARLTRSGAPALTEPVNIPSFTEVFADDLSFAAPFSGVVHHAPGRVVLESSDAVFILAATQWGSIPSDAAVLSAGETLASGVHGRVRVWLRPAGFGWNPTPFFPWSQWRWARHGFLDPHETLGLPRIDDPDRDQVLAERRRGFAAVQDHYWKHPPIIERGWRDTLIDEHGRPLVDMVNNVSAVGHGHPRLARAAAEQWSQLNTNSRFLYRQVSEYTDRLLSTLPEGFDTVLLVNSGSEAVDLAIRLARAYTGGTDVACVRESYHGWTLASDAVSTAISDNPLAEQTRPSWVHPFDAPNAYRGRHRGAQAGQQYAQDAVAEIRRLSHDGVRLAAFIAEPRNGNAGAVEVPPGYLATVYQAVRDQGGVAISDEVQVGFGRQGDVFWGFQQHEGVVPDIITTAKAIGNGHPLGAVITRREIAQALSRQGSFFSSAGGSTLSARIGIEVFDIMRDESLQHNAEVMGRALSAGLAQLADRHPIIGYCHGRGLYQGLELVRSRDSLEPAVSETAWLCDRLLELGVIDQPTGDRQNILKIKPPLCIGEEGVAVFLAALDEALTELEDSGWKETAG